MPAESGTGPGAGSAAGRLQNVPTVVQSVTIVPMRKLVRFLVWTVVIVGAIIGLARLTAVRWWRIPTNDPYLEASVSPTLRGGDLILLWRLTAPEFGDLVLCPEPGAPERVVVGRIVAEGNDRITVKGTGFTVNDKSAEAERACTPKTFETDHPGTGEPVEQFCQIETIRGTSHMRGSIPGSHPAPSTVSQEVPPGNVFLLSDNRLFPYDSRDYGSVPLDSCKETVFFRLVGIKGYLDGETRFTFIQ